MTSVLRIALGYFSMLPLQRQLNAVGLALIGLSALLAGFGSTYGSANAAIVLAVFGAMLVVMTPAFVAGGAMRMASSPMVMHLLPGGRHKMLLGATLAIVLMAGIATYPAVIAQFTQHLMAPRSRPFGDSPFLVFAIFGVCWAGITVAWLVTFILSRSIWVIFMIGLLPMAIIRLMEYFSTWFPDLRYALGLVAAAWLAFALWYTRTGSVRRICLPSLNSASGLEATPLVRLQVMLDSRSRLPLRERAQRHYLLGSSSPWVFALGGVWVVFIIVFMQLVMSKKGPQNVAMLVSMMPAVAFMCGAFGHTAARRARALWLRAGLDRAALFAMAERQMLVVLPAMLAVAGGALLYMAVDTMPGLAPRLPLLAALIILLAACGLYGGMGNTRGMSLLLFVGTCVIAALGFAQTFWLIRAEQLAVPTVAAVLAGTALLAWALRGRARRNWLSLDWRVAKLAGPWKMQV